MGLLAPLFLLGAAAIALPLWLHRLQTKSSTRQAFSSAMLLESTEQQVHVQRKLKYLFLLALRTALLLLIAGAFAKPFLDRAPTAAPPVGAGTTLIVLDTSVSMGRGDAFAEAKATAARLIDDAPSDALVLAVTAAGELKVAAEASTDRSPHQRVIADATLDSERLAYGPLMAQVERLAETLAAPLTVHLISDFQASATPAQFAELIADGVATFTPHLVGDGDARNWWVESVRTSASGIDVVINHQGPEAATVDVRLELEGLAPTTETVAGTGRHSLSFSDLALDPGQHRFSISLDANDDLAADDRWFGVLAVAAPAPVPVVSTNPDGLPATYLEAAIESFDASDFEAQMLAVGEFDTRILDRHPWIIVDNLAQIDDAFESDLSRYLQSGGNVLAFAGEPSGGVATLPLTGHELEAANLGHDLSDGARRFSSIGQVDVQHPSLAGTEGWHRVNVTRSVPIVASGDDEVLIRLDSGEPLLIERALGDGRLLLMLSPLDNRASDLPVHPVFVGFMLEAANYLSGRTPTKRAYLAGENLALSLVGSTAGQVVDPDGETVLSLADTARAQMIRLNKPGIYAVYTQTGETLVATNIDPRESDLSRIPEETLVRWQELTFDDSEATGPAPTIGAAQPLELWPWLLLLLAVVFIAESSLGNVHIATRRAPS